MLKKKTSDPTNEEQQTAQLVNERLEALLLSRELPSALHEAITYSIFPNGKRFRSKFAIFLARDLGLSDDQILEAACSVELIHCASLIHDDLPALDNDEMRRGKPSCHIAFSEATAILAGDTMISLALELAAHHKGDKGREYAIVLARAFTDLCAGQKLDLSPEQERGEVLEIHRLKTGALFAAAATMAAIGAGMSAVEREVIRQFGETLGVLFQITDDYLDIYGPEKERGRPGGSDIRNKKETVFFNMGEINPHKVIKKVEKELTELFANLGEIAASHGFSAELPRTQSIIDKIKARIGPLPAA